MATIAFTNLATSGDSTDATSYTTASVSPTGGRMVYLCVVSSTAASIPNIPTITGNGLTWSYLVGTAGATQRITVYYAKVTGASTGAITIDMAGQTQNGCIWSLVEVEGSRIDGTNGLHSIGDFNVSGATATSGSVDLLNNPSTHTGNRNLSFFSHFANEATTVGTFHTQIGTQNQASPDLAMLSQWNNGINTSTSASWTTSSFWLGAALRIVNADYPILPHLTPWASAAGTAAGATPTMPTHQADDIILLVVESAGGEPVTLSTASGFTAVTNSPVATGAGTAGTQLTLFWVRATSSAMPAPIINDAGDHIFYIINTIRHATTTGNPFDVTATSTKPAASTSATAPAVTTTVDNTLVLSIMARDTDSSTAAFSAYSSSGSLDSIGELYDLGTTQGLGGGMAWVYGIRFVAGTTTALTATVSSSINVSFTLAVKPDLPQNTSTFLQFF